MQITKHAKRRLEEWYDLSGKSSERMARIAYEKGLRHGDLTGNLKKRVGKQYFHNRRANQIRLYGGKTYILHNQGLATVTQIPHNLVKDVVRTCKEKN